MRHFVRTLVTVLACLALSALAAPRPADARKKKLPVPVCGLVVCETELETPATPDTPAVPGKPGSEDTGTPDPCHYVTVDPASVTGPARADYDNAKPADRGVIVRKNCSGVPGEDSYVYVPPTKPIPPTVGAAARHARGILTIPAPAAHFSPSPTAVVNFPTWLAVDSATWGERGNTVTLDGTTVSVTATAYKSVWTMGDGGSETCTGPGRQWTPAAGKDEVSDCSYSYPRSSVGQRPGADGKHAFAASVTSYWKVTYSGSVPGGATETGSLGDLQKTTNFSVPVEEIQTVVTGSGGYQN